MKRFVFSYLFCALLSAPAFAESSDSCRIIDTNQSFADTRAANLPEPAAAIERWHESWAKNETPPRKATRARWDKEGAIHIQQLATARQKWEEEGKALLAESKKTRAKWEKEGKQNLAELDTAQARWLKDCQ